jgi:prolipoprotein diacylglyceryltransferase
MKGIVINVDPTILTIGPVNINWYSIIILLAIFFNWCRNLGG